MKSRHAAVAFALFVWFLMAPPKRICDCPDFNENDCACSSDSSGPLNKWMKIYGWSFDSSDACEDRRNALASQFPMMDGDDQCVYEGDLRLRPDH